MAVKALSYIGVNSDKFEDWSDYSQKYLGMQQWTAEKKFYLLEWMIKNKG